MFLPSMNAFLQDIRAVAELRWIGWSGVVADYWQAQGHRGGGGHYVSPDPRMVVFLDPGAPIGLSTCAEAPGQARIAYVPAGVPIWSRIHRDGEFSHLDLHLSARAFGPARGEGAALPDRPVLLGGHGGIERLAMLIVAEIEAGRTDPLLLDGLLRALLAYFRREAGEAEPAAAAPAGFTPRQRQQVLALIDQNLHRRISVAELAEALGLSESWFARAFRAAMGETPARAIAARRIDRAKALLREDRALSLVDVSMATGFSDQAHFTRVFRAQTGTTPAVWRTLTQA